MYPIPLALDYFTVLHQTCGPLDIYTMPLLAVLYQILFNKVSTCVSMHSLHIYQLNSVPARISYQIILIDLKASGEIKV
jgi:hypothetical protein